MERHRKNEHRSFCQVRRRSFRFFRIHMKMGDGMVKEQQKGHTGTETDDSRYKSPLPHIFGHIQSGEDQTEKGRRHHDACGKAGKTALRTPVKRFFHKKYARRSQRRAYKGNSQSPKYVTHHIFLLPFSSWKTYPAFFLLSFILFL